MLFWCSSHVRSTSFRLPSSFGSLGLAELGVEELYLSQAAHAMFVTHSPRAGVQVHYVKQTWNLKRVLCRLLSFLKGSFFSLGVHRFLNGQPAAHKVRTLEFRLHHGKSGAFSNRGAGIDETLDLPRVRNLGDPYTVKRRVYMQAVKGHSGAGTLEVNNLPVNTPRFPAVAPQHHRIRIFILAAHRKVPFTDHMPTKRSSAES